jgi:hypothetical protein
VSVAVGEKHDGGGAVINESSIEAHPYRFAEANPLVGYVGEPSMIVKGGFEG